MITHVVMMKLKDRSDAAEVVRRLRALPPQIPEIRSYDIGVDELHGPRSWDVVLVSGFDSFEALQTYLQHPAHQDFVAYVDEVCEARAPVDFTR